MTPSFTLIELLCTIDGPSYFFLSVDGFFFISASSVSNRSKSNKFQYSVSFASSSNSSCVSCLYSTFCRSGAGFAARSARICSLFCKIACAVDRFVLRGSYSPTSVPIAPAAPSFTPAPPLIPAPAVVVVPAARRLSIASPPAAVVVVGFLRSGAFNALLVRSLATYTSPSLSLDSSS